MTKEASSSPLIPMHVESVILDPETQAPLVVLKDTEGKTALPIWVGVFEASAIVMMLQNLQTVRPMTHDLMKNLADQAGVQIKRVVIHSVDENTYHASIFWEQEETAEKTQRTERETDARPSDALALALRSNAPIFITEEVAAAAVVFEDFVKRTEDEKYKEFLDNLDPGEFSKYTM